MEDVDSDPDEMYSKVDKRPSVKQTACPQAVMAGDFDGEAAYDNANVQTEECVQSAAFELKGSSIFTFPVDIEETEASTRCKVNNGEYQLNVDIYGISLVNRKAILFNWPYKFIRRYGSGPGVFVIDVGRRAASGEGVFRFKTTTPEKLHATVKAGTNTKFSQCPRPSSIEDLYATVNKPKPSSNGTKTTF